MSTVHWGESVEWEPWRAELLEAFPGWLLPSSARQQVTPEVAARFLSRLIGRADSLDLLRASSLMVAHAGELAEFIDEQLPALVRVLPARTQVEHRTWEGGFHGRLDIRATQQLHFAGQTTRFVTRTRQRDFGLPENVLLRGVAVWLLQELDRLLSAQSGRSGWMEPITRHAEALRTLLNASILREIPTEPLRGHHLQAARWASHPGYDAAARWFTRLHQTFHDSTPESTAKLLSEGALQPLTAAKRFELAVLVRLVSALSARLLGSAGGDRWQIEHALIRYGRKDVVTFHRDDGASLTLFYDVSAFPEGVRSRRTRLRHYLGSAGSQRPDIALRRRYPNQPDSWAVIEIKCSNNRHYIATGFDEAMLYDHEYRTFLKGWPRSVLVSSHELSGPYRPGDPVIAVDWQRWVPEPVLRGLLDGLAP